MSINMVSLYDFEATNEDLRVNTLRAVRDICNICIKCDLSKSRTKVVFGGGTPHAKVMLIGEAPGKNEDEQGQPFVGRAGKLLDNMLLSQGLLRDKNIYITNTVKCRPPENRVPNPEEQDACQIYLDSQIQLLRPRVILLAGSTAMKSLLDTKQSITKIRGKWFEGPFGSKIMPIFHPSYLLRYHSTEPDSPRYLMLKDLKAVREAMDSL